MAVPKTPIWPAEPHTLAKHEILRRYLGPWYAILLRGGFPEIVYLDGFAGPGAYTGGEPGSPFVAVQTFLNHPQRPPNGKVTCIFIEENRNRFKHLEAQLAEIDLPAGIEVFTFHGAFEKQAQRLLQEPQKYGLGRTPTFAFVDPFGFEGLSMGVLARIVKPTASEVFVTFMIDAIERWIFHPDEAVTRHLDAMFGTGAWGAACDLQPVTRRRFLQDLYIQQLQTIAKLRYGRPFEMRDWHGNAIYSLIFGTSGEKGLEVMKESMWRVDTGGAFVFSDATDPDQAVLFVDEPQLHSLRRRICDRFRGTQTLADEVLRFTVVETAFLRKHARGILRALEDEGLIRAVEGTRKKTRSYPAGTVLEFSSSCS